MSFTSRTRATRPHSENNSRKLSTESAYYQPLLRGHIQITTLANCQQNHHTINPCYADTFGEQLTQTVNRITILPTLVTRPQSENNSRKLSTESPYYQPLLRGHIRRTTLANCQQNHHTINPCYADTFGEQLTQTVNRITILPTLVTRPQSENNSRKLSTQSPYYQPLLRGHIRITTLANCQQNRHTINPCYAATFGEQLMQTVNIIPILPTFVTRPHSDNNSSKLSTESPYYQNVCPHTLYF